VKLLRVTTIDDLRPNGNKVHMSASTPASQLSHLHMRVLGAFAHQGHADIEDVAAQLGLPVGVVEQVCEELEAAGLLGAPVGQ
jgi:DNA-binding MarR family transcriptional regulator